MAQKILKLSTKNTQVDIYGNVDESVKSRRGLVRFLTSAVLASALAVSSLSQGDTKSEVIDLHSLNLDFNQVFDEYIDFHDSKPKADASENFDIEALDPKASAIKQLKKREFELIFYILDFDYYKDFYKRINALDGIENKNENEKEKHKDIINQEPSNDSLFKVLEINVVRGEIENFKFVGSMPEGCETLHYEIEKKIIEGALENIDWGWGKNETLVAEMIDYCNDPETKKK